MHIPDADLFEFAFQLRSLLTPGGMAILSLSEGRAVDADGRDADGRLFRERPPAEIALLFERLGFRLVHRDQNRDGLDRGEIRWTTLVLQLDQAAGSRPVDQIETIINHDKKTATYKLALLRALCDIAQTAAHQVRWHANDTVSVPLGLVAERWLYAYWPLIEADIHQIRGSGVAFGRSLTELIGEFRPVGGLDAFHTAYLRNQLTDHQRTVLDETLNKIAATIITGPVTHAGGALDRADDFFSHTGAQTARGRCFTSQALVRHLGRIHFRAEIWRELCLVGHWIGEAILLRWAELTHVFTDRTVPIATVLEKLLVRPESKRDVAMIRGLYAGFSTLECVWTQQRLRATGTDGNSLALDHVIPFSLWHNNELWNLLPAAKAVNREKSDRIVTRAALRASEGRIIGSWQAIRRHEPCRFDQEISRTLLGRNAPETAWEHPAFNALLDAAEMVALQRGVPRWEPSMQSATPGAATGSASHRRSSFASRSLPRAGIQPLERTPPRQAPRQSETKTHDFADIRAEAFIRYLPLVGKLAAGVPLSGFEIADLDAAAGCRWVAVPEHLAGKNRFVIQIAGDSMEPELNVGDRVVFEYHRSPRAPDQIVIANLAELGIASDLTTEHAVKRLIQTPDQWIFHSTNPHYDDIPIAKTDCAYPILGIMVGKL